MNTILVGKKPQSNILTLWHFSQISCFVDQLSLSIPCKNLNQILIKEEKNENLLFLYYFLCS